jgi:hypothetical protein
MFLAYAKLVRKLPSAAVVAATAVFALIAAPSLANAQSLKEIRSQEAEEKRLAQEAAYTNSLCQISLKTHIDWRSIADWPDSVSLSGKCDGALGAIEWFCKTGEGRTRVSRISTFVCAADGSGPSFNGSTLRYGADPVGNGFGETKAYLESKL